MRIARMIALEKLTLVCSLDATMRQKTTRAHEIGQSERLILHPVCGPCATHLTPQSGGNWRLVKALQFKRGQAEERD